MLGLRRLTMNDEKIEIIYSSKELEPFRRDILAGNLCDIFLPVSFIQADGSIGAVYDMHGYKYYGEIKKRGYNINAQIGEGEGMKNGICKIY